MLAATAVKSSLPSFDAQLSKLQPSSSRTVKSAVRGERRQGWVGRGARPPSASVTAARRAPVAPRLPSCQCLTRCAPVPTRASLNSFARPMSCCALSIVPRWQCPPAYSKLVHNQPRYGVRPRTLHRRQDLHFHQFIIRGKCLQISTKTWLKTCKLLTVLGTFMSPKDYTFARWLVKAEILTETWNSWSLKLLNFNY